jgi:hypothetical protein
MMVNSSQPGEGGGASPPPCHSLSILSAAGLPMNKIQRNLDNRKRISIIYDWVDAAISIVRANGNFMYISFCILYYSVFCILYSVLYSEFCILYSIFYILYSVLCILYCTLCCEFDVNEFWLQLCRYWYGYGGGGGRRK